ncbi:MAG: GGDEF domain-containing protein [Candidatus Omnitrophica bacterium]|nr:GGDEF domain-containing protein [Candidatus Omnitrophota bacterium]
MFYLIITALLLGILWQNYIFLAKVKKELSIQYQALCDKNNSLSSINEAVSKKVKELEEKLEEVFFVYELARDIAPILDEDKLLSLYKEKLINFVGLKEVNFTSHPQENFINYKLNTERQIYLSLECIPERIKEHIPIFIHQLNLCLGRIELYNKLQEISIHDYLTGVFNRRHIMERFSEEFERAKKFSFNISFLMVDVDDFKKLNDTYGHIVGDVILREIAYSLKENIREIDSIGRLGGEEFAIILPETNKGSAIIVAKRMQERIALKKIKAFDEKINVTVSIGVSSYPQDSLSSDMLMEIADKAMYKAKQSGKNRVSWF